MEIAIKGVNKTLEAENQMAEQWQLSSLEKANPYSW